jgi:two-component system, NtrC family, sensor kinase
MKLRSRAGSEPVKPRRRKTLRPKRRNALNATPDRAPSAVDLQEQVDALSCELKEAREQQTATADVLKVISRSTFDLQPVLDTLVSSACRLCEADIGTVRYQDGSTYRLAADYGCTPEWRDHLARQSPKPDRGTIFGRTIVDGRTVHIPDVLVDPEFTRLAAQKLMGFRAALGVPLIREGRVFGVVSLLRFAPRSFTEKQIELVETFADQAVIAIENTRLFNETREALERQTATSEILEVISNSPTDTQPAFDAIVRSGLKLFPDAVVAISLPDRVLVKLAAIGGADEAGLEALRGRYPMPLSHKFITGTAILDRREIDLADAHEPPEELTVGAQNLLAGGYRAMTVMPMMRGDETIGALNVIRRHPGLLSGKQRELLRTFANQAVIAIGNARLFDEVQARTRDLTESLEQQTATSEVLQVISASPGELEPVFQSLLENATRVCGAKFGTMNVVEGDVIRRVASYNVPFAYSDAPETQTFRPHPKSGLGQVISTKQVAHIPDLQTSPAYLERNPAVVSFVEVAGARTLTVVPMLKDAELVGMISVYRQEVRPFTDKQIELLSNFARQAVIAIENTRLLGELRESLQQQTATADVLKVISRSAFDLQTVLDTLVESAARLCDADEGTIFQPRDGAYRLAASCGLSHPKKEFLQSHMFMPGKETTVGRVLLEGKTIQVHDTQADPNYRLSGDPRPVRTTLGIPLLREGAPIGVFVLTRREAQPFTDNQMALVQTFADQAVIAIENVRLFDEVQTKTRDLSEALTYQTGSGNILKVIASSPTDIGPVLKAIVESACELCDAYDAVVLLKQGDNLHFSAHHGPIPVKLEKWPINRYSVTGRSVIDRFPVHVHDVLSDEGAEFPEGQEYSRRDGFRSILAMPLLREGECIGVIALRRIEVNPFSDKQIALLRTFADQAVIAIGNVRMFEQVQERTKELSHSLDELRTAQDRLVQTQKLASLGQLTAGIAHEIKNPLNFVNNFSTLSQELVDELGDALKPVALDDKKRAELDELTHMLKGNLEKVVQHGKRADSIVKNMLLHSREGSGERRSVDLNTLVAESLNLAYHGARAENQEFKIKLEQDFDPAAGQVELSPQEITRVLLNLISNGFYATMKRNAEMRDGYEPTLAAATADLGDRVEIRIRDNGGGIPPEVKDKMFNPFFTTKPPGEGTGLGLSLSHDIIVKQHGGSIEVDTRPGEFTEFRVVLPRAAATSKAGANM